MPALPLLLLLLPAGPAAATPRLALSVAARAFLDEGRVEATDPALGWRPPPWTPPPPPVLDGPTPADPSQDPSNVALRTFQYGLALALGLGVQGNRYRITSSGELPGLMRNGDIRGGYPIWSQRSGEGPAAR